MIVNDKPKLVSMSGDVDIDYELLGSDPSYLSEIMGIDEEDSEYLLGLDRFYPDDHRYFNNKYPELMGFWAAIAKVAQKVAKAVPNVVRAIRDRIKERKADKSKGDAQKAEQQRILLLQKQREEEEKKKRIMILLLGAGIFAFLLLRK